MKVKELIEKLESVNQESNVYIAMNCDEPVAAGYIMYADEEGEKGEENEGELEFHDENWGMTGELAILICEEA